MKLSELFQSIREQLNRGGIEASALEAEWIIGYVLKMNPIERIQRPERVVDEAEQKIAQSILNRRARGEPLAYILGEKEFFGFNFKVTPDVLIPRPETEHLVECALQWMRDHFKKGEAIDLLELGVGSGCITVSLLNLVAEVRATVIDVSLKALEVAKENARVFGVEDRLNFIAGDAANASAHVGQKQFDIVLANPPYISPDDPNLDKSVRDFEPNIALFSPGPHGVDIAASWIAQLPKLLKSERVAAGFEFGYNQAKIIDRLFHDTQIFTDHTVLRDYAGHERLIWAERQSMER